MAAKARQPGEISPHTGRTTARFRRLVAELRAKSRANNSPCCLCGQPIDYTLEWPDTRSFSAEHLKSRETHPHLAEDPANLGPAHLGCNSSKGSGPSRPGLGEASTAW